MVSNARQFSEAEFVDSDKPYEYMLECGFGKSDAEFPDNELAKLCGNIGSLAPNHKALAFAIGEMFAPELFTDVAISHLNDVDLSVRLGAYNCLVKLPRDKIPPKTLQRIRDEVSRSPERASLRDFD